MHKPTPMGRPLIIDTSEPDQVRLYDDEVLLNDARPVDWTLSGPEPITCAQAQAASLRDTVSAYPNCFRCGSGRGDQLVEAINDSGFQPAIHSNGDYEIDMVLSRL